MRETEFARSYGADVSTVRGSRVACIKKPAAAGCLECLICDRDRVGHRTAVKLSFARLRPKLPATADQREVARAARCAEIVC